MMFNKKPCWKMLITIGAIVIVGLIILELQFSPNSINACDCVTFKVGQGAIFEPIIATGTVEAENEVLVQCPTTSSKKRKRIPN